ncbi:TPA: hypothetical protein ACQ39K_004883 [Yersinia enterocolitica]
MPLPINSALEHINHATGKSVRSQVNQVCDFSTKYIKEQIKTSRPNLITRLIDWLFGDGTKAEAMMSFTALYLAGNISKIENMGQRADATHSFVTAIKELTYNGVTTMGLTLPDAMDCEKPEILAGNILGSLFELLPISRYKDFFSQLSVFSPSYTLCTQDADSQLSFHGVLRLTSDGISSEESSFQVPFSILSIFDNDFAINWMNLYGAEGSLSLSEKYQEAKAACVASKADLEQAKNAQNALDLIFHSSRCATDIVAAEIAMAFKDYAGLTLDVPGRYTKSADTNRGIIREKINQYVLQCESLQRHCRRALEGANSLRVVAQRHVDDTDALVAAGRVLFEQAHGIKRLAITLKKGKASSQLIADLQRDTGLDFGHHHADLIIERDCNNAVIDRGQATLDILNANAEIRDCSSKINTLKQLPDYCAHARALEEALIRQIEAQDVADKDMKEAMKLLDQSAIIQKTMGTAVQFGCIAEKAIHSIIASLRKPKLLFSALIQATDAITQAAIQYLVKLSEFKKAAQSIYDLTELVDNITSGKTQAYLSDCDKQLLQAILVIQTDAPILTSNQHHLRTLNELESMWLTDDNVVRVDVLNKFAVQSRQQVRESFESVCQDLSDILKRSLFNKIITGDGSSSNERANDLLARGLPDIADPEASSQNLKPTLMFTDQGTINPTFYGADNDTIEFLNVRVASFLQKELSKPSHQTD